MDTKNLPISSLISSLISSPISSSTDRVQLWEKILRTLKAETVAEIGVWKGNFAQQMLERCECIRQYYMVDPWATLPDWNKPLNVAAQNFDAVYEEAMKKTAFAASKITVLRGRTKEVVDRIPDNSLDFAYIDGDHTLRGITIDLIKLLPKIRSGGFIGGDDFINTPWQHDIRYEPTLVCPFSVYFAEAMDLPIVAMPFSQFLIHKEDAAHFTFTDATGHFGDLSLNKLHSASPTSGVPLSSRDQLCR